MGSRSATGAATAPSTHGPPTTTPAPSASAGGQATTGEPPGYWRRRVPSHSNWGCSRWPNASSLSGRKLPLGNRPQCSRPPLPQPARDEHRSTAEDGRGSFERANHRINPEDEAEDADHGSDPDHGVGPAEI